MAKMKPDNLTLEGKELDEMYKKYSSSYGNKNRALKNEFGIGMWDKKYTKAEFQAMYEAQARTMMAQKGWDKIDEKVVIRGLIERQATELTEAQAKAFQKGMKETYNKHYTMKEIYTAAPEKIREMYEQLKTDGYSSSDAKAIISSAFFGSPT